MSKLSALRPDGRAALKATAASLLVVVAIVALQGAVTAALTGGTQQMVAVDSVPQDTDDPAWSDAPTRTVGLQEQQMAVPYGGGSTDEMDVEAVANESHVAFRLSWTDPTNDTSLGAPGNYSDAAAVMLHSGETPPIMMGGAGTPVNIWYWRASWQFGSDDGAWNGDMYAYPHPDNETKPGTAAGNPLSKDGYDQFAQNYYAKGYGSLSNAPNQPVTASATRDGDRWRVTFVRERGTDGQYDAVFDDDEPMYLAFATWNGSADEVNGQKSYSGQFTELDLGNGTLGAADDGSGSDESSGGGSSGESSAAGLVPPDLNGWVGALIGAVVLSWIVAYRRVRE